MMYWLRFALRSCLRRRRRTAIMLAGIAFAIATLVVLGAIMVGVNDTMIENAVALHSGHMASMGGPADISVSLNRAKQWVETSENVPDIQYALPRLKFHAVLQTSSGSLAATLLAVDPEREARCTPISKNIVAGKYLGTREDFLVGNVAARELDIGVGDTVSVVTSTKVYQRRISGVYRTGIDQIDRSISFLPLAAAAEFDEPRVFHEVAYFVRSGTDLATLRRKMAEMARSGESLATWREMLPEVAQLVELNKFSMTIMILLVVIILGFGVSNAMLISVMDRYRSFAILKAMGVRPAEITATILFEATAMCMAAGVLGTVAGALLGAAWGRVGLDLSRYTSYNPHFSVNPVIYPRVTVFMTLVPQVLALCAGILSALWPAAVAARRRVSDTLRGL